MRITQEYILERTLKVGEKAHFTGDFDADFNTIDPNNIKCDELHFHNCTFYDFSLVGVNIKNGIVFNNCTIRGNLVLQNITTENFVLEEEHHTMSLKLNNTKVDGNTEISSCKFKREINIINCPDINALNIFYNELENGGLTIENTTVKGKFDLRKNVIRNDFTFRDSKLMGKVLLFANACSSFCFLKSTFNKDIHLDQGIIDSVIFNNGVFDDDFNITAIKCNSLSLISPEFKTTFKVEYEDLTNSCFNGFKNIHIESCSVSNKISFHGSEDLSNKFEVDKLTIKANDQLKGKFEFTNFNILSAELNGDNNNGNLKFQHISFLELKLIDFINNSKLQFFNIAAIRDRKTLLNIDESNIGETEFYNANLKSFEIVSIKSSILYKVIAINVIWFGKQQLNPSKSIVKEILEKEWKNNREIFRQLKYAMENQGNRINSLDFKSYEMYAFREEMKQHYPKTKKWGNRFILWVSQSNDFGLDFGKPLRLIFFTAIICYCFIVVGVSDKLSFALGNGCEDITLTFSEFRHYLKGLFKMINPLYDLNSAFNIDPKIKVVSSWVGLIDMCYRIILSYLLFQMVSAFRKFVK